MSSSKVPLRTLLESDLPPDLKFEVKYERNARVGRFEVARVSISREFLSGYATLSEAWRQVRDEVEACLDDVPPRVPLELQAPDRYVKAKKYVGGKHVGGERND